MWWLTQNYSGALDVLLNMQIKLNKLIIIMHRYKTMSIRDLWAQNQTLTTI